MGLFVRFESQSSSEEGGTRSYVRKELAALSEEEAEHNERLYEETMSLLFPEESMKDRFYRDKDKENAARLWILSVSSDGDLVIVIDYDKFTISDHRGC